MLPPLFRPPTCESHIGNRARSRPLIPRRDRCQKAILLQSFRHRCRRSLWLVRRIRLNEPLRRSPPRGLEIHAAGDPLLPFSLSILRRSDELDKHGVPTSSISLWLRRIDPVKARSQRDVRRAEIRELSEKKTGVDVSRHRQGCGWQTRDRETLPSRTTKYEASVRRLA